MSRSLPWPVWVPRRWGARGDVLLALALAVLAFVPGIAGQGVDLAALPDRPSDLLGVTLLVAQAAPVAVRRRRPAACLAVVGSAFCAHQLLAYPTTIAALGLLVALFSAGAHLERGRAATVAVAVVGYVGLAVALPSVGSPTRPFDYVVFALVLAVFWIAGTWLRARAAADEERRELLDREIVATERARIARELHDVVTHHVTAMVVQADAAQYLAGEPERTAASLATISESGRHALTDLRYLLGALNGTPESSHEPAVDSVSQLVERSRAAGQPVELTEEGPARPLTGAVGVAVASVVREALTNALKHAPDVRTRVHVVWGERIVQVEIRTDGSVRPGIGRGGGRGLVGMRERIAVLGGALDAGPHEDGGFAVRARIPVEAA